MSQKNLSIIIIVVLSLLIVIGGYLIWWPRYQEFKDKKEELETKDERIKEREGYLVNLKNLSEKLSSYQEEISKIETALSTEPSIAALFEFLKKTSSENGLLIKDTDIGGLYSPKSSGEKIQKMPFSVSFIGSYSSFKNFLSSLYQSSRLIEAKSIKFSSPLKGENFFTFDLGLETYAEQP